MTDLLAFLHALTDPASAESNHVVPAQMPSWLPVGAHEGFLPVFRTNQEGDAVYERNFGSCPQMSAKHLAAGLAIACHSDGKTYRPVPGQPATKSPIQRFLGFPKRAGL